jgi:hypothetical protein
MRQSPCAGASRVVNHSTRHGSSGLSEAQRRRVELGDLVLVCMHCLHPPEAGGALRGIPDVGPYYSDDSEYGAFCSHSCMLGFLLRHPSHRSQMQRAAVIEAAYLEYGDTDVTTAPPQALLEILGGPLSIAEFREQSRARRILRVCAVPLISPMSILEVYQRDDDGLQAAPVQPEAAEPPAGVQSQLNEWTMYRLRQPAVQPDGICEPGSPGEASFYEAYLENTGAAPRETAATPAGRKADRRRPARGPAAPSAAGALARFMKPG